MGDLVHYKVRIFKEAKHAIVELNAHIVFILLEAEGAKKQVFHPVVVEILNQVVLL